MTIDSSTRLPPPPAHRTGWPWGERSATEPSRTALERWPRITIVTVSLNQCRFLEETLRSVLNQGYPDLEYIVVDGGSTDGSVEVLRRYSPWLAHWVSESDGGQSEALNKGFARATGHILAWLNSDDYLAPGCLFTVARTFLDHPGIGAVVGIGHKVDALKNILYSPLPDSVTTTSLFDWCNGQNFMQPACFFSREAWLAGGPLRLDLDFCMDLALWFNIARHFEFKTINETLAFINTHDEAKTVKNRPRMFGEIALLMASLPGGWAASRRLMFKTVDSCKPTPGLAESFRRRMRRMRNSPKR